MSTPVLQALLLADHVYQDRSTGKHVICGVFSELRFIPPSAGGGLPHTPGTPIPVHKTIRAGSPYLYMSFTDVHGQKAFELRYVDLRDNTTLFSTKFQIDCPDPLATVEVSLPLPALPAPHAGVYALELLYDDVLLGSHRVRIVPDTSFGGEQPARREHE
ncbi:MAG: hypothetical protein SFV23_10260 [Planctomycetaceae bacterium]|nr:hypothetical protein [Planctomycetaceae bacterium]